jgi:hypothetical protein
MKLMIARLLWRSQKEEWEAQLEEMVGAMLVLPQALLRLIHGSHSFYTMPMLFCLRLHQTGLKPIQDGNLEPI